MLNRLVHCATLLCVCCTCSGVVYIFNRSAFDWLNEFEAAETFFPEPSHKANGKKQVRVKTLEIKHNTYETQLIILVYLQQILRLADFVQESVKSDVDRALQSVDIDTAMNGAEKGASTSRSCTVKKRKRPLQSSSDLPTAKKQKSKRNLNIGALQSL